MVYLLFSVLLVILGWLVTRDMPSKYRYVALALLLILVIITAFGIYSHRWHQTNNTISTLQQ